MAEWKDLSLNGVVVLNKREVKEYIGVGHHLHQNQE